MLESAGHSQSCFITLTYSDEYLPTNRSLKPSDLKEFHDVVKLFYPDIRYMLVGEYGLLRQRPHYHGLYFGRSLTKAQLEYIWRKGFVDSSGFGIETAAYVAGYIADKLKVDEYPSDIVPPFVRVSSKPGIGMSAVPLLASIAKSEAGQRYIREVGDVPTSVRIQGKLFPVGRFLADKTRQAIGLDNKAERQAKMLSEQEMIRLTPELFDERQALRQVAKDRSAAWHRQRRAKLRL